MQSIKTVNLVILGGALLHHVNTRTLCSVSSRARVVLGCFEGRHIRGLYLKVTYFPG